MCFTGKCSNEFASGDCKLPPGHPCEMEEQQEILTENKEEIPNITDLL